MAAADESFVIAQPPDLHCGGPYFVPNLLERAISEINELQPDVVICSGDLTTFGFKEEYAEAKRYPDRLECDARVVIPGNHDSRNVGYVHFERLFGDRSSVLRAGRTIVADSTEPDLDHGVIGRGRYRGSRASSPATPVCACSSCITTCCRSRDGPRAQRRLRRRRRDRVPATVLRRPRPLRSQARAVRLAARGPLHRQRGDGLDAASPRQREALLQRRRGQRQARHGRRRHPFHGQERIIQFSTETRAYEKYTARIEDEVTSW